MFFCLILLHMGMLIIVFYCVTAYYICTHFLSFLRPFGFYFVNTLHISFGINQNVSFYHKL